MTFPVEISVDLVALALAVVAGLVWYCKMIFRFFDWLESLLPAKLMLVAFGIGFALCSAAQLYSLSTPFPITQLQPVFQWSAFATFVGALLACGLAVFVTLVDALYKHFDPYGF